MAFVFTFARMLYAETLEYLYTRLPLFSRIGAAAIKKDLHNTLALCSSLGNPERRFKTIHVAGTNGKGSVSHMLAAIFQTAGYKTGLYTSPHLHDFRERIKINGEMVSEEYVIRFTQKIIPQIDILEPSFFEITVAMAFEWFAEQEVDVAIIETGLGGRLDSTNVIDPVLSVITNIGWDHMNLLGNSLTQIASEKSGIIKTNTPVVVGEYLPETKPVFVKTAAEKKAPLSFASEKRSVTDWKWAHGDLILDVADLHHADHIHFKLDLPGIYQRHNLLTVLESVSQLQLLGWNITSEMVHTALHSVKKLTGLHARWETIRHKPDVVLDVAHNTNGMEQLLQQLELTPYRELHVVTGMVKDKEVDRVLSLMPRLAYYYFTRSQIPRAMPEQELAALARAHGLEGQTYPDVNTALKAALGKAHEKDLILVCGSVFLAGEVSIEAH